MSITPISAIGVGVLQAAPAGKARGYWTTVGRRIIRDKVSMVCACILIAIFLSALCAPWLGLADPYQGSMIRRLRHIGTPNYPLGTDELGRDMLARLVYGGRRSLGIRVFPPLLPLLFAPPPPPAPPSLPPPPPPPSLPTLSLFL